MLVLDQMKAELTAQQGTLKEVTSAMDVEGRKKRIEELSREMEEPDFWDDPERANKRTKELKNTQDIVEKVNRLNSQFEDIIDLIDMTNEEGVDDNELAAEIRSDIDDFLRTLEELRISNLLSGEYDNSNAILKLAAGAGGTESCDFCQMLFKKIGRAHV